MKHQLQLVIITFLFISIGMISFGQSGKVELYILRKGPTVHLSLAHLGGEFPESIEIFRKSTAPLSKYRKVVTLSSQELRLLKEKRKINLTDDFPESRQLDSFYKTVVTAKDGVIKANPAIKLPKASSDKSVTYGDHKKEASLFEKREKVLSYQDLGIRFKVERSSTTVLLTVGVQSNNIQGEWIIERKTSRPLSSFVKVKQVSEEQKKLIMAGEHVLIDKYPESRRLDSYYRITIINKEGKRIELPSILLERERAH